MEIPYRNSKSSRISHILFLFFLVLCGSLYWPGINSGYLLDDTPNITLNRSLQISSLDQESVMMAAGSMRRETTGIHPYLYRPISYLSFALNYYLSDHPLTGMKATNIVIHLAIGCLVYFFCLKLFPCLIRGSEGLREEISLLSVITASFWLLHPLFVSTVLYIVQRMAMLSTLFILSGCIIFLHYRKRWLSENAGFYPAICLIILFTSLGFLCKENGLLLPVFCLVIEIVCFRFQFHPLVNRTLRIIYFILIMAPVIGLLFYLAFIYFTEPGNILEFRSFTLYKRLLTESRVLWSYLGWLSLIEYNNVGFFHDDIPISKGLLDPLSTFISITGWILVILLSAGLIIKDRFRILSFSVLWFLCGHLLESTVVPLEPAFEHRNYLPGLGPLLMLTYIIYRLAGYGIRSRRLHAVLLSGMLVFIPGSFLHQRIQRWSSLPDLVSHMIKAAPGSPRSWGFYGTVMRWGGDYTHAEYGFRKAYELNKSEAGYLFAVIFLLCEQNKPVPGGLIDETLAALDTPPTTATTYNHFMFLSEECNHPEFDEPLTKVYRAASRSEHKKMAALGHFMLALAAERKGEIDSAIIHLQQVIILNPREPSPRQLLETLQRRRK